MRRIELFVKTQLQFLHVLKKEGTTCKWHMTMNTVKQLCLTDPLKVSKWALYDTILKSVLLHWTNPGVCQWFRKRMLFLIQMPEAESNIHSPLLRPISGSSADKCSTFFTCQSLTIPVCCLVLGGWCVHRQQQQAEQMLGFIREPLPHAADLWDTVAFIFSFRVLSHLCFSIGSNQKVVSLIWLVRCENSSRTKNITLRSWRSS